MTNLLQSQIRKLFPFIIKYMKKGGGILLHSYLVYAMEEGAYPGAT